MSAWVGLNRRKFPRVSFPCMILVRNDGDERDVFLTHTENLGIGGICIIFKKNIKMFSSVDIELDMMDFGKNIKCQGRVVWSIRRKMNEENKPLYYDIGIEFVDLEETDQNRINEVVHRLAKQGKVVPHT